MKDLKFLGPKILATVVFIALLSLIGIGNIKILPLFILFFIAVFALIFFLNKTAKARARMEKPESKLGPIFQIIALVVFIAALSALGFIHGIVGYIIWFVLISAIVALVFILIRKHQRHSDLIKANPLLNLIFGCFLALLAIIVPLLLVHGTTNAEWKATNPPVLLKAMFASETQQDGSQGPVINQEYQSLIDLLEFNKSNEPVIKAGNQKQVRQMIEAASEKYFAKLAEQATADSFKFFKPVISLSSIFTKRDDLGEAVFDDSIGVKKQEVVADETMPDTGTADVAVQQDSVAEPVKLEVIGKSSVPTLMMRLGMPAGYWFPVLGKVLIGLVLLLFFMLAALILLDKKNANPTHKLLGYLAIIAMSLVPGLGVMIFTQSTQTAVSAYLIAMICVILAYPAWSILSKKKD